MSLSGPGRLAALLVVWLAAGTAGDAASRYDPRLRFRTIVTPGFDIHYHQGEERLARRVAVMAEEVAVDLESRLGRPRGRVHVILVDQSDLSNGWATPVPYNLIEITVAPPPAASTIGNTDDWIRLVFVHEYIHILHLDRSRGWANGLRRVFGRHPLFFPNLFLPVWQIEGIAVYHESRMTPGGRLPARDFLTVLDRLAAEGRFDPLDRASGGLIDWPSGAAPYLYGGYFHEYLARRFGEASLHELADRTAGALPYLGSRAYRAVFGQPLGALWRDFEADTRRQTQNREPAGTRLTRHGFTVSGPRFEPDGRLLYSVVDPHGFPSLLEWRGADQKPRRVARRFLGEQVTSAAGWVLFDQLEFVRNVGLQADLYVVGRNGGRPRRLTHGARASDPDFAPDGRTFVCTVQEVDRRGLATAGFAGGALTGPLVPLVSEPGLDLGSPRWSPDGRWIVAERRRPGVPSELVLVDPADGSVRTLISLDERRAMTPTWTPDARRVIFAAETEERTFQLHGVEIDSGVVRRITEAPGGATFPAVSPDGRRVVFVSLTSDGHDLWEAPLVDDGAAVPRPPVEAAARRGGLAQEPALDSTAGRDRAYSPARTLWPRAWSPIVERDAGELLIGAGTAGVDALGRHGYAASAAWAGRARPDWAAAYAYDRWWPTLFLQASDDTDPWRGGERRTREVNAGAFMPLRSVRLTHSALAAFTATDDRLLCPTCPTPIDQQIARRAWRLGWTANSSRQYGYSISPDDGARIIAATELVRPELGSEGAAGSLVVDTRGYVRLGPGHAVLAVRGAAAATWGDERVRRAFSAGGAGPLGGGPAFGVDAIGLLRGFAEDDVVGRRAAVVNADYRFPLVRIERGRGTIPLFLRTLHGAVFVDAGHAWSTAFALGDARTSLGAELSLDTVLGYAAPVTVTGGVAWRHVAGRSAGTAWFARIGRAF